LDPRPILRISATDEIDDVGRTGLEEVDGVPKGQVATLGFANEQGSSRRPRRFSSIRFGWVENGLVSGRELPALIVLVSLYLHHSEKRDSEQWGTLERIRKAGNPQAFLTRTTTETPEEIVVVETDETRRARAVPGRPRPRRRCRWQ
jgi:hypothetical protein